MIIYKKGNYSEPLRTKKADASCSHVSGRFSCSQGGSEVYPDSKHEIFNADDDTLEKFYSDIFDFWA